MSTLRVAVVRGRGALVRLLEQVRRRGFEVSRLVARPVEDGRTLDVTLTVEGGAGERLARHLGEVGGVQRVEVA